MNKTFSGKVALVTGGTSGIGKATAIEFARAGAKVVLTGRREKEGAQVVAEIRKLGGEAAFVRADVAKDGRETDGRFYGRKIRSARHRL
jgi:NAD(P)-dependent dehydrogenase (short-subunit alcohol dehydrogenase family)